MTYETLQQLWTGGASEIETLTSGSTGNPKIILLPRQVVRDSAWRTIRAFNLSRDSWLHSCISPETIGGKMQCIRALELGARFTSEHPSNTPLDWFGPGDWLSLVSVVPSQVEHILDRLEKRTLPFIETLLIGGAPIPPALRRRIASSPLNAFESYGMTETASHIAIRKVTENPAPFIPLPGITVSLNEKGCLRIHLPVSDGHSISASSCAEDTSSLIIDTNDIAGITPEGFTITGRYDNIINSGGKKIIPEEIEKILASHACEGYVSSLPDDKWGEKAVLVIPDRAYMPRALESIKTISPHWKRPKSIIVLSEIPLTSNGKIDRPALRTRIAHLSPVTEA